MMINLHSESGVGSDLAGLKLQANGLCNIVLTIHPAQVFFFLMQFHPIIASMSLSVSKKSKKRRNFRFTLSSTPLFVGHFALCPSYPFEQKINC